MMSEKCIACEKLSDEVSCGKCGFVYNSLGHWSNCLKGKNCPLCGVLQSMEMYSKPIAETVERCPKCGKPKDHSDHKFDSRWDGAGCIGFICDSKPLGDPKAVDGPYKVEALSYRDEVGQAYRITGPGIDRTSTDEWALKVMAENWNFGYAQGRQFRDAEFRVEAQAYAEKIRDEKDKAHKLEAEVSRLRGALKIARFHVYRNQENHDCPDEGCPICDDLEIVDAALNPPSEGVGDPCKKCETGKLIMHETRKELMCDICQYC